MAVWRRPRDCFEVVGYTQVRELPAVEVAARGAGWRAERLSTGELYVQYDKVFEELDRCFSAYDRPCRLLLYGPPGTGKSYAPRFFGRKWGRCVVVKSPGQLVSKWVGETEENVHRAVEEAERTNCVAVFDEGDVFLRQRFTQERTWDTVNVLLTAVQELRRGGVVVTTNVPPHKLDPALLRGGRLKPVAVPLPTREMIETYAKLKGLQAPPGAQNFAEVDDPRAATAETDWYYMLHPLDAGQLHYVVEAERGVWSLWLTSPELTIVALWLYYSAQGRQVWWVRRPQQDYSYVINMADEYGAVVVIDPLAAADALRFIKPPQRALIFVVAQAVTLPRPVVKVARATYRSVEEAVRETIIKMKPSCRAEFPGDVAAKFFWNNC
ncbi:MAG: ATP-binding protein [Pyrobaculum sp.]